MIILKLVGLPLCPLTLKFFKKEGSTNGVVPSGKKNSLTDDVHD